MEYDDSRDDLAAIDRDHDGILTASDALAYLEYADTVEYA